MTFSFKSAALSAAVVTSLFAGSLAHAGNKPVDTTPPPVVVVIPRLILTEIALFVGNTGLRDLATPLQSAKPGSPEALAAVASIITVISQRASMPTLTRSQQQRARSALQVIMRSVGESPALAALLARL